MSQNPLPIYHVEAIDEERAPGRYCVVDHHGGVLVELSTVEGGTMTREQMGRLCNVLNASKGYVLAGRPRVTPLATKVDESTTTRAGGHRQAAVRS